MIYREFWEAGYRVFPLLGAHDLDGQELPDKEKFKRPRAAGFQHTPVWSEEQLELMEETDQFSTGYGVLCHGLIVVDVDARNGGVASWHKLAQDCPEVAGAEFIVETGSGGGSKHLYFAAPEGVALVQHLPQYPGLDFKSSGFVVGPGSMHSSGARYTAVVGSPDAIEPAPASLIDLLRKPERHRAEYNGAHVDVSHDDLAAMLGHVDPDCDHETWVRCGMACHDASQGTAFSVWNDWSSRGAKYPGTADLEKRWHSFGKSANPVTIGTLVHYAEQGGWQWPVEFTHDGAFDLPQVTAVDVLSTDGVDLLRPPGFVGEVKSWIDDQCMYPREHLATAAALVAVGNVVGLRYTDDLSDVTTNLFAFGVADSSSGKESVLQAAQAVLVETGISAATHGMQKSQQEVMRNLLRHQAAFYMIDEFGIELKKVVNAQKKGSAAYLEGLIGSLMSLYSKANGFALMSGDVKEEVRASLQKDLAQSNKAVEENDDKTGFHARRATRLQHQLDTLDKGLDRPFLSLLGFTTPSTFDAIIDEDQATSGFLGRALLVREHESNPRPKKSFRKRPMSEKMRLTLQTLYDGGEYDAMRDRVEHYGDRIKIRTAPDAIAALDSILDWFIDYAEAQKERTGLEAVVRRGYELVAKVSTILAVPSGVRTLEHVRWAFALVKRDIEEKMRLVMSNDVSHGRDRNLMAKITKIISKDHGETFGVIANKLRAYSKDDVRKALDMMESGGSVKRETKQHPKTGAQIERWFFVG